MTDPIGQVVLYKADDGAISLAVTLRAETVWLSLSQIAELLGRDKAVIPRHLHSIFKSKE